jgi:hypothetical protein
MSVRAILVMYALLELTTCMCKVILGYLRRRLMRQNMERKG